MAGLFSSNLLEQIRAASDIVDVIGSYLPLKRAGANFVALCPFHKEKSPSFNVNPHRQIFHCFGCHKGGDVFTFVKEYESIDFVEAVKRLADRAKITLEYEQGEGAQQAKHLKDTLLQIHEQIAQRWHNCLLNEAAGQVARDYLAKRGVSAEAIKLFRIGAAPDAWDDTVNWAKSKDHDIATVEKSGLIIRKEETGNYYDRFRGRLMFPICDEQGRVIGFSGRVLSGDEKTAKYVNSPETPIFTKSKVFFGLDKSKRAILDAGFAIICEGQLDLIACFMGGVQNIVAPQGTAFTEQHARIITRYANEVVICFDSDTAGQKASVRGLESLLASGVFGKMNASSAALSPGARMQDALLSSGLAIRVAVLPDPHDPDSFIKEFGSEAFQTLINKAEGFFDFYLKHLCATNDAISDRGKMAIARSMAEVLQRTKNHLLIDDYAQKTAMRLGVSAQSVLSEFNKIALNAEGKYISQEVSEEKGAEIVRPSPQEFWLLKLIFLHENLVEWYVVNTRAEWIQNPVVQQVFAKRMEAHRTRSWTGLGAFLDGCETPEMQNLVTEAATENRPIPNPQQQLADVALRLRNQFIERQLVDLSQRMSRPGVDDAERMELLRRQQELRQLKRQPMPPPTG